MQNCVAPSSGLLRGSRQRPASPPRTRTTGVCSLRLGATRVRSQTLRTCSPQPLCSPSARSGKRFRVPRPPIRLSPHPVLFGGALIVRTQGRRGGFFGQVVVFHRDLPVSFGPLCRVLH